MIGGAVGEHLFDIAPDHKPRHIVFFKPRHRFGRDMAAIAQHRHPVGDGFDFIKLVGNIQDRDTLRAQAPDLIKQDLDLAPGQNRGRLIQNQDIGLFRKRLGDLNHLTVRHRKIANACARIDITLQLIQKLLRLCAHGCLIKEPAAFDFTAQKDVFFDGQLFGKVQFLMDQDHAVGFANFTVGKLDRGLIKDQFPAARLMISRKNFHKCRFARTIFAQKRMDLTGMQIDGHIEKHLCRAK